MKHFNFRLFILFFGLSLGWQNSFAQISINNSYIPRVGDTLFLATDNLPSGIEISGPGPNQRWDFTTLQAPFGQHNFILPAEAGRVAGTFPNAEAVSNPGAATEFYYNITNSKFELVGISGYDPLNLGVDLTVKVNPPLLERRSPLRYGDERESEGAIAVSFPADALPGNILDQLPIRPDSFRIRTFFKRENVVDAWGALTIPGGVYDVLREKRTETTEIRIESKLGFLPWVNITGLLPDLGGLPQDTIVNYYFFTNEIKEPIAILTTDNFTRRITRAVYKASDVISGLSDPPERRPGVYAFPNPAIVNVRFEFANLPAGEYRLTIYNILGVEVWNRRYFINGPRTEKVDISSFRKGTYLYTITDEKGKTITTKRLIVIRP